MAEILSHFGGVAGDVLRRTLRRSTWVSGMALVSALFLTARGLGSIEQAGLFPIAALLLVSLGLAYHGVRAAAAHASTFEPTDGRTFVVATRVAIASAVWFVPWKLWGSSLGSASPVLDSIGAPSPLAAGLSTRRRVEGTTHPWAAPPEQKPVPALLQRRSTNTSMIS